MATKYKIDPKHGYHHLHLATVIEGPSADIIEETHEEQLLKQEISNVDEEEVSARRREAVLSKQAEDELNELMEIIFRLNCKLKASEETRQQLHENVRTQKIAFQASEEQLKISRANALEDKRTAEDWQKEANNNISLLNKEIRRLREENAKLQCDLREQKVAAQKQEASLVEQYQAEIKKSRSLLDVEKTKNAALQSQLFEQEASTASLTQIEQELTPRSRLP